MSENKVINHPLIDRIAEIEDRLEKMEDQMEANSIVLTWVMRHTIGHDESFLFLCQIANDYEHQGEFFKPMVVAFDEIREHLENHQLMEKIAKEAEQ